MKHVVIVIFFFVTACAGFRPPPLVVPKTALVGASLYLEKGDTDGAIKALKESNRIAPSPYAHFLLGDIFDIIGDPKRALNHYMKVLVSVHQEGGALLEANAAAMAIVAIRDRVPGFYDIFDDFYARFGNSRGALPQEAWFQLNNLRLGMARRSPDTSALPNALSRMGCLTQWEASGPLGPFLWKRYENATPPMPGKTWPIAMDLGPGRGKSPFRTVQTSSCFVALQNAGMSLPGLTWARTTITLNKATDVHFRLQTSQGIKIFAGGVEIYAKDPRKSWPANVEWFHVTLPAGATEIAVAVAAFDLPPSFSLVSVDASGLPAATASLGGPLPLGVPASDSLRLPIRVPENQVSQYAALKMALWWDAIELATRLIQVLGKGDSGLSPALLASQAEAEMSDPSLPGDVAFERARAIEVRALDAEPRLWQLRVNLSDRAFADGLTSNAVSLLQDGISLAPNEPMLKRRLLSVFTSEGWIREASAALKALSKLMPNNCNTLKWCLNLVRRTQKFELVRELAAKVMRCDASSPTLAEEYLRSQDWQGAAEERQRLAKRDPFRATSHLDTMRAALAGGKDEIVSSGAASNLIPFIGDPSIRLFFVDMLSAEGDTEGALRTLHEGAAMPHAPGLSFLSAEASILETPLLQAVRVDGLDIVETYNALKPNYDTASVFVLDRAVHIVGQLGDLTTVVHTISHLRTDEAIETHGEFSLPAGAALLRARTIKKNGRILTPERIPRKSSISFPGLEAGDFIETEYVLHVQPNRIYPSGFDTERFYFQDFETAFHRSEMIVSVPRDTEIQVDPRGPCPRPTRQEKGDRINHTWRVKGVLPSPSEPLSPVPTEYLPSIRVSKAVTWPNVFARMSDLLAEKDRPSRHIQSALMEAIADRPKNEHLVGIYQYVLNHIEPGDDFFEQASHNVARKSGDRARAFHALARAAGFSSRLALVKPSGRDERGRLAHDYVNYDTRLVEIPGKAWLCFDVASAPFGFLPPRLRHRPVRYLDNGSIGKTNGGIIPFDSQTIKMALEIVDQKSVKGKITETLSGVLANDWRLEFMSKPREEWKKRFDERYLSAAIPGAELKTLSIKNIGSPKAPLIIEYRFFLENFARPEAGTLTARIPYPILLRQQVGGLPMRTTPLVLSSWIQKKVEVAVINKINPGVQFVHSGRDSVESHFGRAGRWVESKQGMLRFGYDAILRVDRVEPDAYPAFLAFATDVDRISEMEITWSP